MKSKSKGGAEGVLAEIQRFMSREKRSPTIRELQTRLGYKSPRAVTYFLEKLAEEGKIVRRKNSRGIQLPHESGAFSSRVIPWFASIPAGLADPSEAVEPSGYLTVLPELFGLPEKGEAFAVRVRGDSMVGEGIHDGDLVFLERRPAKSGDIVAALVDGETTLKTLVRSGGKVILRAANPKYPDVEPEESLQIQGVMVGLARSMGRAPSKFEAVKVRSGE